MALDNNTYKKIYEYLNSTMSIEEVLAFEETLSNNNELRETVIILKKMDLVYSPEDWLLLDKNSNSLKEAIALFRNEDVIDFSQRIRSTEAQFKTARKSNLKRILIYVSSIAAIGLILFSGYLFESQLSNQELYNQYYNLEQLPSFISKNDTDDKLTKAELLFKDKKYEEALILFKSEKDNKSNKNPSLLIYLALTNSELNKYDIAIDYLLELEKSNAIDYHKAYWFKAMVYLKQGDIEKVIFTLKLITQNKANFNYEKAVSLLKELNENNI